MDRARRSVERALQLKPRLLRAGAAEGFVLMASDPPDSAGAERALREVLAQDPNMSDALLWLRNILQMQGRDDEARRFWSAPRHRPAPSVDRHEPGGPPAP